MAYEKILEVLATFRQHGSLRLVVRGGRKQDEGGESCYGIAEIWHIYVAQSSCKSV